jgi:hypothetical protein
MPNASFMTLDSTVCAPDHHTGVHNNRSMSLECKPPRCQIGPGMLVPGTTRFGDRRTLQIRYQIEVRGFKLESGPAGATMLVGNDM